MTDDLELRKAFGLPVTEPKQPAVVKTPGKFGAELKQTVTDADRARTFNSERNDILEKLKNPNLSSDDRYRFQKDLEAIERELSKLPAEVRSEQFKVATDDQDLRRAFGLDSQAPQPDKTVPVAAAPEPKKGPTLPTITSMFGKEAANVPGAKEAEAFGKVAGGTISKSFSAVQQLIGQYFPGLDEPTREKIMANAQQNIKEAESQMAGAKKEYPKTALAGEVTGYITSPVSKLVPGFGPSASISGAALKGGGQGMIAAPLMEPVESKELPFGSEKLKQAATGLFFGGAGGAAFQSFSLGAGKTIDAIRQKFGGMVPDAQLSKQADEVLKAAGVDATKFPADYLQGLKDQAKLALQTGDLKGFKNFARNFAEAEEAGVPMLRGQLNRDPMQFAVEQNIRGIPGVGEKIMETITQQNRRFFELLDEFGAKAGTSIINSGATLKNGLMKSDEEIARKVSEAYKAYKKSSGRDIDVPLQGLAQDYARVLKDYGKDNIPSGVRNNLNELGLLTGKQLKVTTIDDAERLIKNINQNYDPSKQTSSTINALDNLRASINKAIYDAGANLPGQAGAAAKAARNTAKERFDTIDAIPALKDVIKGKEPDKFVQNHILRGNVNEIKQMRQFLEKNNPETLAQVQNDILAHIKNSAAKNVSAENAEFSQATFRNFVTGQTGDRLRQFLSPEQFKNLEKLNRISENALVAPAGAAVNRSNTAQAAATLVDATIRSGEINQLLSKIISLKLPVVGTAAERAAQAWQSRKASGLIEEAVRPTVPKAPRTEIRLSDFLPPGVTGVGAGRGIIEQRNLEAENR